MFIFTHTLVLDTWPMFNFVHLCISIIKTSGFEVCHKSWGVSVLFHLSMVETFLGVLYCHIICHTVLHWPLRLESTLWRVLQFNLVAQECDIVQKPILNWACFHKSELQIRVSPLGDFICLHWEILRHLHWEIRYLHWEILTILHSIDPIEAGLVPAGLRF